MVARDNEQGRSEAPGGTQEARRSMTRRPARSTVSAEDIRRLVAKLKGEEAKK